MLSRLLLFLALSSCYLRHFPLTPAIVTDATFKVINGDEAQGTAWAVDQHHLVTAGHVCANLSDSYTLIGLHGRMFHAHAMVWEMSDDGLHDLCILETPAYLGSWLVVAEKMPKVGDKVQFVGFPQGHYSISSGHYLGDLDGKETMNNYAFDAPCDHGASGSPVYTPDGVWGALVRVRTDGGSIHDGEDGCVAVALDTIRKLLDDNQVHYDTPPHLPPPLPGDEPRQGA